VQYVAVCEGEAKYEDLKKGGMIVGPQAELQTPSLRLDFEVQVLVEKMTSRVEEYRMR
jgi:hypothetical protein